MNDTISSLIRHAITAAGAVVIARGWGDETMINEIAGAAVAIVGFLLRKRAARQTV